VKVLLSIKPEYVEKILNGSKKFEFRKNIFKKEGIKTVVIYSTMPVGKVVAEFEIEDILCEEPSSIWNVTKREAGISKEFFDSYYDGRDKAVAIQVGKLKKYAEPFCISLLGDRVKPPQSYRYL